MDLAWEGLEPARERGLTRLARATIERLPFTSASFDAATSFEVVYHLGVANDIRAFQEIRRVLKSGGVFLLRVPAHDWLRGEHDRLVHTRHRYSPRRSSRQTGGGGFQRRTADLGEQPAVPAGRRQAATGARAGRNPRCRAGPLAAARPDQQRAGKRIAVEALAIPRRVPLPFGLSVLAVARAV